MIDLEPTLIDSEGEEVLCPCGNKSVGFIANEKYVKIFCENCSILEVVEPAEFKYVAHKEIDRSNKILNDAWVLNIREVPYE